jgi:hypothetical protein
MESAKISFVKVADTILSSILTTFFLEKLRLFPIFAQNLKPQSYDKETITFCRNHFHGKHDSR